MTWYDDGWREIIQKAHLTSRYNMQCTKKQYYITMGIDSLQLRFLKENAAKY